ncbi:MAG: alpha-2-macroglobulin family protein, partial [Alphaproteobacteria bacterium]|nr:alpha-2-macroglobulin family protein [Alphaproteobacteria bacterium]
MVPTRTVALFSGIVETDDQGRADIRFEVPDFTGQLRLMAVAWDGHRVGEGDAVAIIRDPLTGEVILPRFLAPGDQGTATISLHAVEGPGGAVEARLEALDAVALAGEGAHRLTLAAGERRSITVPLRGLTTGLGTINLALSGPEGLSVRRSWPIEVRPAQPVIHDREIAQIKPGEAWTPPANLLARFEPGTARATLEVAPWRGFDLVGLLRRLDQYPLGCVEQTTSRALPLLAVAELAPLAGLPVGPELRDRLQRAVWRVADMQTVDGDFGMWGPSDYSDNWLSVYALDFLTRAEAAGLHVPPETMKQGRDFLRKLTANHNTLRQRAYAYWVLARLNEASPGDLRYL